MKTVIVALAIAVTVLFPPRSYSQDERWKAVGKSRTDTAWYIDSKSVVHGPEHIVAGWVRSIPSKKDSAQGDGEEGAWKTMRDIQEKYFGDYEYTEALWEINCADDTFRILYFAVYDAKGEITSSSLTPEAVWTPVMPGSAGEVLRESLCAASQP